MTSFYHKNRVRTSSGRKLLLSDFKKRCNCQSRMDTWENSISKFITITTSNYFLNINFYMWLRMAQILQTMEMISQKEKRWGKISKHCRNRQMNDAFLIWNRLVPTWMRGTSFHGNWSHGQWLKYYGFVKFNSTQLNHQLNSRLSSVKTIGKQTLCDTLAGDQIICDTSAGDHITCDTLAGKIKKQRQYH